MKVDSIYLQHILECIRRMEENIASGKEPFLSSHTLQDAVLRNLQTLSEATQRLSDETKSAQPEVAWREIAAFRNILVHNYLGIDLEIVWEVIQNDVPKLKEVVRSILDAAQ